MIFYDSETCGFHGPMVLLQYAVDDGPIHLYNVWEKPIGETLELIEWMLEDIHVGFNLSFDHFHLQRIYNLFDYYVRHGKGKTDHIPMHHIDAIAVCDGPARLGSCIKPAGALDLMLAARKGKYQSLMERSAIRIRRIPTQLAWDVRDELERRIRFDGIYFARRKDKNAPQWKVYDIDDDPDFKDIVLRFQASGALKSLAVFALGHDPDNVYEFGDIKIDSSANPKEFGFAPFAGAGGGRPGNWKEEWPEKIWSHCSHWYFNSLARKYAEDDVKYTRELYHHLGCPEPNDDDSILATMVGSVRWRGFSIDLDRVRMLRDDALVRQAKVPTAPHTARAYLEQVMSEDEKIIVAGSTKKVLLEEISKWTLEPDDDEFTMDSWTPDDMSQPDLSEVLEDSESPVADMFDSVPELSSKPHPAAVRAREVLEARRAMWEVNMFDKLLQAQRFHASFNVIGTLSSRMSGRDGLNAQGIAHDDKIRTCFPLADSGYDLGGGDFDAFEVALAEAVYKDPKLREALVAGIKIHALFAMKLWPGMTYEDVMKTKATEDDKYLKGKSGVFAMIYGGDPGTLKNKLGVQLEVAEAAYQEFINDFPGVGEARKKTFEKFCSMRQPGGIGSKVEWHEPHNYVESLFGFRRYFTLENQICKVLFELAQKPPRSWRDIKIKVKRRDRMQTASGAAQSALYAAAFGLQAANMRAAANHEIQSSGAQITKRLQCRIWMLQPCGVSVWVVVPMNVHDEIMCPHLREIAEELKAAVSEIIEYYKSTVPLIDMKWQNDLKTWAGKS